MPSEMSSAERVRQTLMICGTKAMVVRMAAMNPTMGVR